MTSNEQQRIDQALGQKEWKNVGTAKIASSGRSLVLELLLITDLSKPCYIGLQALDKLMKGEFRDATIYQMKKEELK